jgi:short-subunit dehydrogenase
MGKRLVWQRALVTGASGGLGAAFARRLAAEGTDLILVARDEERLHALADTLKAAHAIEVEVLAADLASVEGATRVAERLAVAPTVDLLVNNAAIGSKGTFAELPLNGELRQVELNVSALVRLTHAAIRHMVARGAGTVVNVSSLSGLQPEPTAATYAATKAFVISLSEALFVETRGTGVNVTLVLPGYIRTDFQKHTGNAEGYAQIPGFMWLTPERVARDALDAARQGRADSVSGYGYRLVAALLAIAPRWSLRRFSAITAKFR